jgi:class 3 adenylate cyclase
MEMRPVAALFADIVGSARLGERLGPNEVKALVRECVSRMARAVEEVGPHDPAPACGSRATSSGCS